MEGESIKSITKKVKSATKNELYLMAQNLELPSDGTKEILQMVLLNHFHNVGTEPSDVPKFGPLVANKEIPDANDDCSDMQSRVDSDNPFEVEARAISFLQCMKEILVKKTIELRLKGKIRNPMMLSKHALAETVATNLLVDELLNGKQGMSTSLPRSGMPATPPGDLAAMTVSFEKFNRYQID